nr:MAG TPA: hypothetical protein [Caudoviricetes sp.]
MSPCGCTAVRLERFPVITTAVRWTGCCRHGVVNGLPEPPKKIVSNRCAKLVLQNCRTEFGLFYLSLYFIRGPPSATFLSPKF